MTSVDHGNRVPMRATNTDAMRCDMLNITVVVALETVFWGFIIYLIGISPCSSHVQDD